MGHIYLRNDQPGGDHEEVDHPGDFGSPYIDPRDGRIWTHADPNAFWPGNGGELPIYERADRAAESDE
ncbi:MAG: hypothetical protein ABSA03_22375 [Streptosporangiaceae bacterium]|jgi:hypothetical protein